MKNQLKEFLIFIPTEFGIGLIRKNAKSFEDAFLKLGKKDRMKDGYIEDENGDSITFSSILRIEETI
jgi:hypothetical protein